MKVQQVELDRTYRWRMRDVRITRQSPLAPGGHEVAWEAVDGGPSFSTSAPERAFCSEAEPLVGLDEAIVLGDVATTIRCQFAAHEATSHRSHGKGLDGPTPTTHTATIWANGHTLTVPISRADYEEMGGIVVR